MSRGQLKEALLVAQVQPHNVNILTTYNGGWKCRRKKTLLMGLPSYD
jgi:hypothetical protein